MSASLRILALLVFIGSLLPATAGDRPGSEHKASDRTGIEVAFAPWDDAESLLNETIAGARRQILVQAFLLTSRTFAFSLIDARSRGVEVLVLADGRQHADTPASLLELLQQHGITVWLETRYRHAHNKIVVIDADQHNGGYGARPVVISGSYNFTWGAQHLNAENLIVIRDRVALARRFARNWWRHQQQATPLQSLPRGDLEH
jgi:phosphatidylserine/phosphatidylglycerophosphate/cardiolipin synthase-like enzyme